MSTKVDVSVLPQTELLNAVCSVRIARRGESWSESCLGSGAKDQGVYIIHHAGRIKYVGKIDGASMSFGIRLRREFQEAASQGRHIFPRLAALSVPPDIAVRLLPTAEIRKLVSVTDATLTDAQLIPIYEAVLIQVYRPEFQT